MPWKDTVEDQAQLDSEDLVANHEIQESQNGGSNTTSKEDNLHISVESMNESEGMFKPMSSINDKCPEVVALDASMWINEASEAVSNPVSPSKHQIKVHEPTGVEINEVTAKNSGKNDCNKIEKSRSASILSVGEDKDTEAVSRHATFGDNQVYPELDKDIQVDSPKGASNEVNSNSPLKVQVDPVNTDSHEDAGKTP